MFAEGIKDYYDNKSNCGIIYICPGRKSITASGNKNRGYRGTVALIMNFEKV
jgi:hypothetical protein